MQNAGNASHPETGCHLDTPQSSQCVDCKKDIEKDSMQCRLNTLNYYKTAHGDGDQGEHNVFTGLGFADRGSPSCWVVPQTLPP